MSWKQAKHTTAMIMESIIVQTKTNISFFVYMFVPFFSAFTIKPIAIRIACIIERKRPTSPSKKINDVKSTRGKKTLGIFSPNMKRKNKDNKEYMQYAKRMSERMIHMPQSPSRIVKIGIMMEITKTM
jgi:hypothetical protein